MVEITAEVQSLIDAAVDRARTKPVPWETLRKTMVAHRDIIRLDDRPEDFKRPDSEHVQLGLIRASISFEEQPIGLCKHLSAGLEMPEALVPSEVFHRIVAAFGMNPTGRGVVWVEEWRPNHYATHLVDLADGGKARLAVIEDMAIADAIHDILREGRFG